MNTSRSGTFYPVGYKFTTIYYNGTSTTKTTNFSYNSMTSLSSTIDMSSYDNARTGYLFQGWTTTSSFSNNTTSAPSMTTGTSVSQSAASATYYAVYGRLWLFYSTDSSNPSFATGTYYMYNVGTSASYSLSYDPGDTSYYDFVGWATSSTSTSYSTSASLTTIIGGFYAVWKKNTTVYYNNTYTATTTNLSLSTKVATNSQSISLSSYDRDRTHYDFYGWADSRKRVTNNQTSAPSSSYVTTSTSVTQTENDDTF